VQAGRAKSMCVRVCLSVSVVCWSPAANQLTKSLSLPPPSLPPSLAPSLPPYLPPSLFSLSFSLPLSLSPFPSSLSLSLSISLSLHLFHSPSPPPLLSPPHSLSRRTGECGFLAANLYAKSIFGEDALVNVSIEKQRDGTLGGNLRIRSKTQGIALSLGVCLGFFLQQRLL
jgi:hypothetical protein